MSEDTKRARQAPGRSGGVLQTDFTPSKGNAMQACVATVLGLGLDDVPNFIAESGDFYDNLRSFLARHSLGFLKVNLDKDGALPFAPGATDITCVVAGDSPRGAHRHVVVGRVPAGSTAVEFDFDPHPSGDMITSKTWVGLFVATLRNY